MISSREVNKIAFFVTHLTHSLMVIQISTNLRQPDLQGVKPSDLLGDLEVCDAFRRQSLLITPPTTTQSTPPTTQSTTSTTNTVRTTTKPTPKLKNSEQRGRSGSRTFTDSNNDFDNRIPTNSMILCNDFIFMMCSQSDFEAFSLLFF